uniref:Uncharacterized protein n=1 Tax=Coccidioides posadasii RMSCC 3488 TaxID=454284 RepID=A0A0J6FKY2_COCPO|nr:hypothetical protein CPAG_07300 [Coccidioides posadasii RMSCC 3488]
MGEYDKNWRVVCGPVDLLGATGGPNTRKVAEVLSLSVPRSEREQQSSPIKRIVSGRRPGQKFGEMAWVIHPTNARVHCCTFAHAHLYGVLLFSCPPSDLSDDARFT